MFNQGILIFLAVVILAVFFFGHILEHRGVSNGHKIATTTALAGIVSVGLLLGFLKTNFLTAVGNVYGSAENYHSVAAYAAQPKRHRDRVALTGSTRHMERTAESRRHMVPR